MLLPNRQRLTASVPGVGSAFFGVRAPAYIVNLLISNIFRAKNDIAYFSTTLAPALTNGTLTLENLNFGSFMPER